MIRVKEFAKAELIPTEGNSNNLGDVNTIDIETISLSSTEEKPTKVNVSKKCETQTPKPRKKTQQERLPASIKKGRTPKPPLHYKYHKIDEYFQARKNDSVLKPEKSSNVITNGEKSEEVNDIRRNLRQVKIVLRRLSIDQIVETSRKRKQQNDQTKLPQFIQHETAQEGYFTIHKESSLPQEIQIQSEDSDSGPAEKKPKIDSIKTVHEIDQNSDQTSISSGQSKRSMNLRKKAQKKSIECPYYKIIEDTKFAVDAFRYGDIDGVKSYFLTHFHADHYIGLKKSFNHTLYLSNISGRLVMQFIKVAKRYIRCLDINTPIVVDDVEVTALDANHCPGAVMFLFRFKTGKCILHTGDMRASPEMEEYPEFWNNQIDTIYLDTTYLSKKYDFLTQSESIKITIDYCDEFIKSSTSSTRKHLIICGAYKIGKEKVWLRIAQTFGYKVWIDTERYKAIQCIQNKDILDVLTNFSKDAQIHVLPLGNLNYQFIVNYVKQFGETFSKVLVIRPSGWEKRKSKPNFNNQINIVGVQYSEHSSYSELERFVRFLQPKKVISTVPICNKNVLKTAKIPDDWLNSKKLQPKTKTYQKNIMDFMVKNNITD